LDKILNPSHIKVCSYPKHYKTKGESSSQWVRLSICTVLHLRSWWPTCRYSRSKL